MTPTTPSHRPYRIQSQEEPYFSDQQIATSSVAKIHDFLKIYFHIRFKDVIPHLAVKPYTQRTYHCALDLIEKNPAIFPISVSPQYFERKLTRIRKDEWDPIYFSAELRISQAAYDALLRHSNRF